MWGNKDKIDDPATPKKKWSSIIQFPSTDNIGVFVGFIVIALIIVLGDIAKDKVVEYLKNQEWSFASLSLDAQVSTRVNIQAIELRTKLGANRVGIYLFHNGTVFSNGIAYKKASLVYELLDSSTAPISSANQNIPLSQISDIMKALVQKESTFFLSTSTMVDSSWKWQLYYDGIKSSYYRRIVDGDKLMGYIIVTFNQDIEESLEVEHTIDIYTGIIGNLLKREGRF